MQTEDPTRTLRDPRALERWAVAALLAYWALLVHHAFSTGFAIDELMNIYSAWTKSWSRLFLDCLRFWGVEDRPLTCLLNRTVYLLFGFHHLPFRITALALQALNIVLQYLLARRLTGSRCAALFAALFASVHFFLWDIYASDATLYDTLCGALSFTLLLFYFRRRVWTARPALLLTVLSILALDAKEMGLTIVASALAWTVIVERRRPSWWPCLALLPSVIYVAYRVLHPGAIGTLDSYKAVFTWERAATCALAYTNRLLMPYAQLEWPAVALLWLAVFAAAAWISRRALWGVLFFWMTLSPLLAVQPRMNGYVLYIPLFGLALAAGEALLRLRAALAVHPAWRLRATAASFAAVALLQCSEQRRFNFATLPFSRDIANLNRQLPSLLPKPQTHTDVLLLNSPFSAFSPWDAMYVFTLHFQRRDISVTARDGAAAPGFDHVIEYDAATRRYRNTTTGGKI